MKKIHLMATACGLAFAGTASAQDSARKDEIIVTAQKREQSIQDVGLSVTAIGSETLRDSRILEMREIATYVSNVDIREQAPGLLPVITIRGVGLNDFSATNNPPAGVYVDEIYLSSLTLLAFDFYDLERIEVLKGPQGTLYGRNSTAGAINFISAKPNFDGPAAMLSATYGNFDTLEVEGMANLPVSDTLAIRLSAKTIQQYEGVYFNRTTGEDVGRRDVALGRAQIRWTPTERADINLKVEAVSVNSEYGQGAFFGARDFTNPPSFNCASLANAVQDPTCTDNLGYSDQDGDPFSGDWAAANFVDSNQINVALRGAFDLGGVELTSVTGFIDAEGASLSDIDASPNTALEFIPTSDIRQYSQEFRLAGDAGSTFTWLVGAFWSRDHIITGSNGFFDDFFLTQTAQSGDQVTTSAAGFVNGEYKLTDTLTLNGGLRFTWEEKEYTAAVFDTNPFGSSCLLSLTCTPGFTGPVLIASTTDARIDDTNLSWKTGLDWKPADNTLVYASVSRGVKSGGFFSGFASNNASFLPYEPESLRSYEVGLKHSTDDGALRVAAAGFYYDYKNIQTFIRDNTLAVPVQRLGNVEEATLYGLDFEATLAPPSIEGFSLGVGLGLLDSELGPFDPGTGIILDGNEFPNAPGVTFNTLARYERPIGTSLRGLVQIDGRYTASTFKDAVNEPIIAAEGYTLWNARAAIGPEDGAWEAAFWAKNIFDELYKVQGVNLTALGFGYDNFNNPRTFGGTLTVRF